MYLPEAKDWHFDIDVYINSYVPQNHIHLLPKPISHFLGHREMPRRQTGNLLVAGWAFLGAFVGVIAIEATFMIPAIHNLGGPLLIASFVRHTSKLHLMLLIISRALQRSSNTMPLSLPLLSLEMRSLDISLPLSSALGLQSSSASVPTSKIYDG